MNNIISIFRKTDEVKKDTKEKLLHEIVNNNNISLQAKIKAIWLTLENKNIKIKESFIRKHT